MEISLIMPSSRAGKADAAGRPLADGGDTAQFGPTIESGWSSTVSPPNDIGLSILYDRKVNVELISYSVPAPYSPIDPQLPAKTDRRLPERRRLRGVPVLWTGTN
jgi:hypothetical protein